MSNIAINGGTVTATCGPVSIDGGAIYNTLESQYPGTTLFASFDECHQHTFNFNYCCVNRVDANFINTSIQLVQMGTTRYVYVDADLNYTIDYKNSFNQRMTQSYSGPHVRLQYQFANNVPLSNIALNPYQVRCCYNYGRLTIRTRYCANVYVYQ